MSGLGVGFLLTVAGFKLVVPEDPYAMLDDTYLETLKKDDDIANEAAKNVWTMTLRWGGQMKLNETTDTVRKQIIRKSTLL